MDVFRMKNPTLSTPVSQGRIINSLKDKLWIERYREPGEFKFIADVDSGAKEQLPVGSLISHIDTKEVMVVENHEITETEDEIPEIVITGRSFETVLSQRAVGANAAMTGGLFDDPVSDYTLPLTETWNQISLLISNHVVMASQINPDNGFPFVIVAQTVGGTGIEEERIVPRGDLYTRAFELLAIDDLGIKTIRPGVWTDWYILEPESLGIIIHKGEDKTSEIMFSYESGDIKRADYFWSNRNKKTSAYVYGKWVHVFLTGPEENYDRRMISVDASDIDNQYSADPPIGTDRTRIIQAMNARGLQALANQTDIVLSKAEVNDNIFDVQYRKDYDVGDIVSVVGNYNAESVMRITEYVEIEDENGRSGHPTLAAL